MIRRRLAEVRAAYVEAFGPGGVAFASPQIAFIAALALAYGGGLAVAGSTIGARFPITLFAVVTAIVSALAGIGLVWTRWRPATRPAAPSPTAPRNGSWLLWIGVALVIIGTVSLGFYLLRIGGIPLFLPSAEAERVAAAERGGAALRVLSFLSSPGAWLIVAWAAWNRRRGTLLLGILIVAMVAGLQVLTANRAPAVQAVSVAALVVILASGRQRLRALGLTGLAGFAIAVVVLAGAIGAVRLGSSLYYGPPTEPGTIYIGPARDYGKLTLLAIRGYAIVPARNFSSTLEAVPSRIGFRYGYTYLQPLLTILPGRQTTFDQDLKASLGQRYVGGGTVPSLLGEAYANFGPLGWLLVPFLVGVAITALYREAQAANRPAFWALYGFALVHVAGGTISGLLVANIFPVIAYAILGLAAYVDLHGLTPPSWRRVSRQDPSG